MNRSLASWTADGPRTGNEIRLRSGLANRNPESVSIENGMRISAAEEAELIARAQRGDVEAFCELAANHQRSLYVLALKYSGNHHDAEDLTQDVMLNAYRAIQQFRGLSSFHTW